MGASARFRRCIGMTQTVSSADYTDLRRFPARSWTAGAGSRGSARAPAGVPAPVSSTRTGDICEICIVRIDPPAECSRESRSNPRNPALESHRGAKPESHAQHRRRRLSRLRDAADDGRGAATRPRRAKPFPTAPIIGLPGLPPDARRLGGLLAARPDSAVVLVPGRRRAAVLARAPAGAAARRCGPLFAHAVWRSLLLIALGIFLRSIGTAARPTSPSRTRSRRSAWATRSCSCWRSGPSRAQWTALGVDPRRLLAGVGALPGAGAGFDYQAVGVPADWTHHYSGLAAHWNKNSNLGQAFDVVVPEPVPAREAVCRQRRRLPDAELHPDAGRR